MAVVREAKRNGQWDRALQRESAAGLPADLADALDGVEGGRAAFAGLAPSHRRRYLAWIEEARRPETRARRIAETVRRAREFSEGGAG